MNSFQRERIKPATSAMVWFSFVGAILAFWMTATPINATNSSHFAWRVGPMIPTDGCWVGAAIDYATWDFKLKPYIKQAGFIPAAWNLAIELPLTPQDLSKLQSLLPEMAAYNSIVILTVDPVNGTSADVLPDQAILQLCAIITAAEKAGARIIVRYAHQMNGVWWVQSSCIALTMAALLAVVPLGLSAEEGRAVIPCR
jgi:hypothetical protein